MSDVNWRPISEWEPQENVPYFVRAEFTDDLLGETKTGYMLLWGRLRHGFDESMKIEPNESGAYVHKNTFGMTRITHFARAESEDNNV